MDTQANIKNKKPQIHLKSPNTAVPEHLLHHLAFDNSLQPNIVSIISSGKIILANKAACKLLGYSKKEILTKTRANIFDISESSFKKMLKQRNLEGHSAVQVKVIKKKGKRILCEITTSLFKGEHGFVNSITTITDLRQSILRQKNIDFKKEKLVATNIALAISKQEDINVIKEKLVADNIVLAKSKQKRIDTKKEKIVADNIVLAKSKQKRIDTKKKKIVTNNIVLAKAKQKKIDAKKEKIVADNIILAQAKCDAHIAKNNERLKYIRDANGRANWMTGVLHDLNWQKEMEERFEQKIVAKEKLFMEQEEKFKLIINSSTDVLFDNDLITKKVLLSNAYEKLYGYQITKNMTPSDDWMSHIYPDDQAALFKDFTRAIESNDMEWKYSYRFLKANNSVVNVTNIAIILRDITGKAYRIIGSMHDNSVQQMLEEKLEQEIKLKEKQVTEAVEDAKEMERSDIGKELHDNINQLLGASRMYLDMAKRGGASSAEYLSKSSEYTLLAIEEIRKLTKGLTNDIIKNLGLYEAIDTLSDDTMEVSPIKIFCSTVGFNEHSVNDKFKLNVYRIVQEQLNNILKHAKATEVKIDILQNKKFILLSIADDGVGFDTGKKREGIGVTNIKSRASSFNGAADFVSQPGRGCVLEVKFPLPMR